MTLKFERAPILRRVAAVSLDCIPAVAIGVATGAAMATQPYLPPPGWFWSEWLLKLWLDVPRQLVVPVIVFVCAWLLWALAWEAAISRTPGGRLAGLSVVDGRGIPIGFGRALRRAIGGAMNVATLGFGAVWAVVDPEGRGLHDYVAGTWVVRER